MDTNVKTVIYFDDYLWNTDVAYNFQSANAFHTQGLTKGIMTGMLVRNLETGVWYKNINYVDYRSRIIQQYSQNHLGGIDRSDYQYRFNDEVLKMRMVHQGITEIYDYLYNNTGQKISFKHTKDGVTQNVARYDFDEINRLQTKIFKPSGTSIGTKQTGNWTDVNTWLSGFLPSVNDNVTINAGQTITIPAGEKVSAGILNDKGILKNFGTLNMGKFTTSDLQTVDYSYNIRNNLRGLNLDALGNLTNKIFSMKLSYEEGTSGYFDGNIKNQYWKSNLDGIQRAYEFYYDGDSRIIQANYGSNKAGENYALNSVSYDANGNIKTLSRNGLKSNNTFGVIDNLAYTYQNNSNKLQAVTDISLETASFSDATGLTDYTYSQDGSLTTDANKGITLIEYNYLKRPKKFTFSNGSTLENQYDATGKKLKSISSDGTVYDFVGNKIYKNGALYQISHDEGRIINGEYEFEIKDHLGNLRVSFRDSLGVAKITQKQDYDVYGSELQGLSYTKPLWNRDDFKFLGRESIAQTGLVDLINRQYDRVLGRFTSQDPVTDGQEHLSLYQYGWNNPVLKSDPNGLFPGQGLWNSIKNWFSATPSKENKKLGEMYSRTAYNGQSRTPQTNGQLVVDAVASSMQVIGQEHRGGLGMTRAALTRQKRNVPVPSARVAASTHAEELRTSSSGKLPTVTGAAVDISNGKVSVQVSGKPNPTALHPTLAESAPNPSLMPWSVCNCGETKAVNVLLNEGSSIQNIKYHAVRTKTGESMEPCLNCQQTLQKATQEKND